MTDSTRAQLATLLDDLEAELKKLDFWSEAPPPNTQFESDMPFFADVMTLEHWLQWVLISQFRYMLDKSHPLPQSCSVAPYAEEVLKHNEEDTRLLIDLLKQIDDLFDD